MSDLLQCGWDESVRLCHWINCHGTGPCSGIPASQYTRSRADEITRLQTSLAAANNLIRYHEEVHADHRRLVREIDIIMNGDGAAKQASLCDLVPQIRQLVGLWDSEVNDLESAKSALANAPARDKS